MAVIELTLLGGFRARWGSGQVIDLPGQKTGHCLQSWLSVLVPATRAISWPAFFGAIEPINKPAIV